jgi:hypothetical protein
LLGGEQQLRHTAGRHLPRARVPSRTHAFLFQPSAISPLSRMAFNRRAFFAATENPSTRMVGVKDAPVGARR